MEDAGGTRNQRLRERKVKHVSLDRVEKVERVEIPLPLVSSPSSPPALPDTPLRRAVRLAGAQRFADSAHHDEALHLGWTWDRLYGDHGAASLLGNDRVLYVTHVLIMACSPQGEAKPIYKGVSY
jgi:hypothetical protein